MMGTTFLYNMKKQKKNIYAHCWSTLLVQYFYNHIFSIPNKICNCAVIVLHSNTFLLTKICLTKVTQKWSINVTQKFHKCYSKVVSETLLRIDPYALITIDPQALLKSTQNRLTNVT